jgi:putative alpha-1,2-mannosidase
MSAWYVLSAMGFYPVNPAAGAYVFGSPLFNEAEIELPGDKSFKIIAENNSAENLYIQSAELDGKPYEKSFITHKDILKGGVLKLTMGSKPNRNFGVKPENRPKSMVY